MALESEVAIQLMYDKLTADASLSGETDIANRVVDTIAPPDTTEPYIIIQFQSGFDVNGVGAVRIMVDDEFLVKAVKKSLSFDSDLRKFARRIDTALHNISGTTSGGEVFSLVSQREFRLVEVESGEQYRHLGRFFSAHVQ